MQRSSVKNKLLHIIFASKGSIQYAPVGLFRNFMPKAASNYCGEVFFFTHSLCLFKQPRSVIYHWNQYKEILKKCNPFVCNAKKAYSSFIIQ